MQRSLESLIPLYFVYLSKGELRGRTRLQKLTFLVQMESQEEVNYDFKKYIYGPCSYKLYSIIDNLVSLGFLESKELKTSSGNSVICYKLSPMGRSLVIAALRNNGIPKPLSANIKKVFKIYGKLSIIALIRRVYKEHPDWTEKSIFMF